MSQRSGRLPRPIFPGADKLTKWFDQLCGAIDELRNVSTTGIISVTRRPGAGWHFRVPDFPIQIGITTTTVTARASVTPGNGHAAFQTFNGTSFVADASATSVKVYNWSANSGGVASGKYVILIKVYGYWFIISVEC